MKKIIFCQYPVLHDEDGDKIKPYALIIGPTRELVQQIQREFVKLAKNTNIKCEYAVGQHAVRDQLDRCAGCDVLVATPGRLNDFVGKNKVSLDNCEYFIIDEADRMLEMGFQEILNELTIKIGYCCHYNHYLIARN